MAHTISDRWLWLGVGIAIFIAVKGIKYAISDIVNITQLPLDKQDPDEEETKFPEDSRPIISFTFCFSLTSSPAISLTTLGTLSTSPNPRISTAARGILIRRFAALPNATEILEADLNSTKPIVRRRAQQAVRYLEEWDEEVTPGYEGRQQMEQDVLLQWEEPYNPRLNSDENWDERPGYVDAAVDRIVSRIDEELEIPVSGRGGRVSAEVLQREDEDEERRRRRRREAIVLHEGGGSVGEEDIIRPPPDGQR